MTRSPRVSRAAYLLGYAGLLPQMLAVALLASSHLGPDLHGYARAFGAMLALGYGALILSFLGGVWWGFAVRRGTEQGALAAVAVLPSLAAGAVMLAAIVAETASGPLVALGAAIIATIIVDRRLVATGEAPEGWMRLRAPLSLGLGGLTILAGLLA